jgi:hypothetical protein
LVGVRYSERYLLNKFGFIWIIISIIVLTIWHVPFIIDFAALHEPIHILQHFSFIIVGATVFLAIRALGESFKIIQIENIRIREPMLQ